MVEGKAALIGEAMKQCLLSMKDMWDNNNDGEIYGFVTTRQMFRYNGVLFKGSRKMGMLFLGVENDGGMDDWMMNYTVAVDCLLVALMIKGGNEEGCGCLIERGGGRWYVCLFFFEIGFLYAVGA